MPQTYPFRSILQGDDWYDTLTWYQSDGVTPVNLTGAKARLQATAVGSGVPVILIDLSGPAAPATLTLGGSAGTIAWHVGGGVVGNTFTAPITTTADIDCRVYQSVHIAIKVTLSGGVEETLVEGLATITPQEVAAP